MTALLTVSEAAELLSISPHTLRRWVSQQRVPCRKLGGCVWFTEADVEEIVRGAYREVREPEERTCRVPVGPLKWVRI